MNQPSADIPESVERPFSATASPGYLPGDVTGFGEGAGQTVLVVEDESLARISIRATLLKNGFKVIEAESGEAALNLFDQTTPLVVILDIGLPGLNGFEVCQKIRQKREDVAILMLTARTDPMDKINGLDLGADDYLVKPFHPDELVARIRAVLRRSSLRPPPEDPISFMNLTLEFHPQKAFKNGVDVNLSPREFTILAALLRRPGQIMSREDLGKEVWGESRGGNARALDVFVCKLRDKIEDDPSSPRIVKTIRGAGYTCG